MGQNFKETAHLKTDLKKYGENYDAIFGKKERTVDNNENATVSRETDGVIQGAKDQASLDPKINISYLELEDMVDEYLNSVYDLKELFDLKYKAQNP